MDAGKLNVVEDYANDFLEMPKSLPNLSGQWRVLVYPARIKEKTKSGIILPDDSAESLQKLMTVGIVCEMGRACYKQKRFINEETGEYDPWCKVGDWVVFNRAGYMSSVIHEGKAFTLIPDDAVLYTVNHPSECDPRYEYGDAEIEDFKIKLKNYHEAKNK